MFPSFLFSLLLTLSLFYTLQALWLEVSILWVFQTPSQHLSAYLLRASSQTTEKIQLLSHSKDLKYFNKDFLQESTQSPRHGSVKRGSWTVHQTMICNLTILSSNLRKGISSMLLSKMASDFPISLLNSYQLI